MVREVLISQAKGFARADVVCDALRVFDGESVLVGEGDSWRQQRRLLQQGMRSQRLRSYARKAAEHARGMLRQWPSSGVIRAGDEMSAVCKKVPFDVLLGTQPPPDLEGSIRIVLDARAVETGKAVSSRRRYPPAQTQERDRALQQLRRFLDELIRQRRAEADAPGDDLVGMLVRASQPHLEDEKARRQTDRRIRDETSSMMNASLDATAAAMSWTLFLVAKHDAVQTRLREEIERGVAEHSEAAADYSPLPFAEMVVHEALRLYPPNWLLIPRRCVQESIIGGYRIARGSWVYIFPYVIHRDARWFREPEVFDPDRFAPEHFGRVQRSAYLPLGLGPHVCLGRALSTIIVTTILACILQEFQLELPHGYADMEPEVRIVIRPKGGLPLIANRRTSR